MGEEGAWGVGTPPKFVLLREVEESDLSQLMFHRNQWGTRRWLENCKVVTPDDQKRWFATQSRSVRIAMDGKAAVGIARCSLDGMDCYSVGGDVLLEHRGHGYGTAVFRAACDRAAYLGAASLSLWVFVENEKAVRIYKQAGFEWDYAAATKTFYRPIEEGGAPTPWLYARMIKGIK